MYYHVLIEITDNEVYELDKTDLSEIESDIVKPFINKEQFQFNGYIISHDKVKRLKILESKETTTYYSTLENDKMSPGVLMYISREDILDFDEYFKDITNQVMKTVKGKSLDSTSIPQATNNRRVFIVHGRDEAAKISIARFIEKLELEAVILHEQASTGMTIIEKLERHTDVAYAIVLLTPDDVGSLRNNTDNLKSRARQNVIFEHGYLNAKLGRQRVCALVKEDTEIPSDLSRIVYIELDESDAWKLKLAKEMRDAGLSFDFENIT